MEKMYQLFKVSGKSMEADNLYQGDFIIVDSKIKIKNHDIVVLSLPDSSLFVKHLLKKKKHLYFYPFSQKIPMNKSGRLMDDAMIIGKVVGIIKRKEAK